MLLPLEEDKALTSWPFVSEFTHITALKTSTVLAPLALLREEYTLLQQNLCVNSRG